MLKEEGPNFMAFSECPNFTSEEICGTRKIRDIECTSVGILVYTYWSFCGSFLRCKTNFMKVEIPNWQSSNVEDGSQ